MSTFDKDLVQNGEEYLKRKYNANQEWNISIFHHQGALVVWYGDIDFLSKFDEFVSPGTPHGTVDLCKVEPVPEEMRMHQGRPVLILDCATLCKDDAKGFLHKLSKMPDTPKPIVVIKNITDIPPQDDVHDDPRYVENLLLNSWKEVIAHHTFPKFGSFEVIFGNYTVLIPVDVNKKNRVNLAILRNLAQIDFDKEYGEWLASTGSN